MFLNRINVQPLSEYYSNVARDKIKLTKSQTKFGEAENISTSETTVWDGNVLYPWQNSSLIFTLSSTVADDSITGTGARQIYVYGLDSNYDEQEEIVSLNGLTPVSLTKSFLRVNRMIVISAGSLGKASGQILLKNSTVTYAKILNGNNQTLMCVYTVPRGKTAFITSASSTSSQGKSVKGSFYVRPFGMVFQLKYRWYMYQNFVDLDLRIPYLVPEKSDVEIRALSSASGTSVTGSWQMEIIDN